MATLYNSSVSTSAYSKSSGYVISSAYTFRLEVIEDSISTNDNTSTVTVNVYIKGRNSSWSFSGYSNAKATVSRTNPAGSSSTIIDQGYSSHSGTSSEVRIATKTETISHLEDGSATVSYVFDWHGANTGNVSSGLPKSCNISTGNISLSKINRAADFTLSPQLMIDETVPLSITINKVVPSYWYSVYWRINNTGTWNQIGTRSQDDLYTLPFATVAAQLSTNTSARVGILVRTYTSQTGAEVAPNDEAHTKYVKIQTGTIPFSLYDDMHGNVGVHFGQEATAPGIYINGDGPFEVKDVTIGGISYKILAMEN
jgi:hypothetical protein